MKCIYGPERYPIGSKIKVKGSKHVKSGEIGEVKGYDPMTHHKLRVKFSDGVYIIEGKHVVLEEMGA